MSRITFILEEIDDEVGISIEVPEGIDEESAIMQIAAHMFGSVKLKDEMFTGSSTLQ